MIIEINIRFEFRITIENEIKLWI